MSSVFTLTGLLERESVPFNLTNTLDRIVTYLQGDGGISSAQAGDPKAPPVGVTRVFASVIMRSTSIVALTLNGTIELHVILIRLYRDMLAEPQKSIEIDLATAAQRIQADIAGEYDLGGSIRSVDVGGSYGEPLRTDWGYVTISNTMYRIVDITVPLLVDDSAVLVA